MIGNIYVYKFIDSFVARFGGYYPVFITTVALLLAWIFLQRFLPPQRVAAGLKGSKWGLLVAVLLLVGFNAFVFLVTLAGNQSGDAGMAPAIFLFYSIVALPAVLPIAGFIGFAVGALRGRPNAPLQNRQRQWPWTAAGILLILLALPPSIIVGYYSHLRRQVHSSSPDVLRRMYHHPMVEVSRYGLFSNLVANPDLPPDILDELSFHRSEPVRVWAARNPNISCESLLRLRKEAEWSFSIGGVGNDLKKRLEACDERSRP